MTMPKPTRSINTVVKITTSGERFMDYTFDRGSWRVGVIISATANNASYRRRPVCARSTEAMPPPEIKSAIDIAPSATGYSMPLGAKNSGQWTPKTAVIMVQSMKKAPTRVNRPNMIRMLPRNSDNAAMAHHNHAGRMKLNGVCPLLMKALKPGPPKLPRTFCAPWANMMPPSANLIGKVNHTGHVMIIFRNM